MDDIVLTALETSQLEAHEATIAAGLRTFVEVGKALQAIRDERLYRQTHPTFEAYCRERWKIVASRARQLIAAAEVVTNLESVTNCNAPNTEGVARVLVPLTPEDQHAAWQEAVATAPNGRITAVHVQQIVEKHQSKEETKDPRQPEVYEAECGAKYTIVGPVRCPFCAQVMPGGSIDASRQLMREAALREGKTL